MTWPWSSPSPPAQVEPADAPSTACREHWPRCWASSPSSPSPTPRPSPCDVAAVISPCSGCWACTAAPPAHRDRAGRRAGARRRGRRRRARSGARARPVGRRGRQRPAPGRDRVPRRRDRGSSRSPSPPWPSSAPSLSRRSAGRLRRRTRPEGGVAMSTPAPNPRHPTASGRSRPMTTISTTAIGPPLEAEGTAAGGSRGLVAVGVVAALAAMALAASCLTESDLEAGGWVRSALVVIWALAAIVLALRAAPALGVVVGGAAVVGGICAATAFSADLAEVHMIAAALVPAVALHLELVLPDGLFGRSSRRNLAVAGYVVAGATGVALALAGREPAAVVVAAAVVGMLLVGLPSAHQTYQSSAGLARQRLQLVGCAVAVIAEVALVVAALRILVDWPDPRRRGRRGSHRPRAVGAGRRNQHPRGPPGRPAARAHRVGHGPHGGRRARLPGHRHRSRPGPRRQRAHAARALDAGRGRRRAPLRPRSRAAGRDRQPARLRGAPSPRRGAAHLGQPAQPVDPDGRAPVAAGRVPAEGARAAARRDLDRLRRSARAGGRRPGSVGPSPRARAGGATGGHSRRG